MKVSFSLFATVLTALVAQSSTAYAEFYLSPGQSQELTQCIQKLAQESKTHPPRTVELKVGKSWSCAKVMYYRLGEVGSSETQTIVLPMGTSEPQYLFTKEAWGVTNRIGTAKFAKEGVEYLAFGDGGIEGVLGVPYGIGNGFMWDFLLMAPTGELIAEESIMAGDAKNHIIGAHAPQALATPEHRAYQYSICRPTDVVSQITSVSCFSALGF